MLVIEVKEDSLAVATLVATGPEPAHPSLYGSGWVRYDIEYREAADVTWRGEVHVPSAETYLEQLRRIAARYKKDRKGVPAK